MKGKMAEPHVGFGKPQKMGKSIVTPSDPTGGKSVSKSGSYKK